MLILCVYRLCVFPRIGYVYISRRGNIVSSPFILLGRLAMPQFCGRKATSLTSFLFLYPNKQTVQGLHGQVYAHCAKD